MKSLQDDYKSTKNALKTKESNIESITEKLYKHQAFIGRIFNEFKQMNQY